MATKSKKKPETRTVKHRLFTYFVEVDDPIRPGKKVTQERIARRGDVLQVSDLNDIDVNRGDYHDAFFKEAELVRRPNEEEEVPVSEAGNEDLEAWLRGERGDKPTADEVVEAAEGDPATAKRLLDAENSTTGNDPRDAVVAGLAAVVANAGQ